MKAERYFNKVSIEVDKRLPSIVSSRRTSRILYKKHDKKTYFLTLLTGFIF